MSYLMKVILSKRSIGGVNIGRVQLLSQSLSAEAQDSVWLWPSSPPASVATNVAKRNVRLFV